MSIKENAEISLEKLFKKHTNVFLKLLKAAPCPNADCNNGLISTQTGFMRWRTHQCQWCLKRKQAISNIEKLENHENVPRGTNEEEKQKAPKQRDSIEDQDKDIRPVTDFQIKRMFALCHENEVTNDQLKDYLYREHGIQISEEINRDQYKRICDWIKGSK